MASPTPPFARPGLAGGRRVLAVLLGIVVTAAALKLARAVLVPLALGLFLALLARPLDVRLARHLPRWLALLITALAILGVFGAFAGALAWTGRSVATEWRERRPEIEASVGRMAEQARARGIPVPFAGNAPNGAGSAAADTTGVPGEAQAERVARSVIEQVSGILLALAIAVLALAEASVLRRRLEQALTPHARDETLSAVDEASDAFRRYVWVKSLTSLITGTATWLVCLAFGLPLAWVWGFMAFLLEYVPTVGSVLAILPPTLMAFAESAGSGGGVGRPLLVFLAVGTMQVLFGNVIDPRIEGRLMAISPLFVLVSIVVWGWLWGAVGALLAVPLTVAIVIACRHIPAARGVAVVLAGDSPARDDASPSSEDTRRARGGRDSAA